jgi:serine protease AprX
MARSVLLVLSALLAAVTLSDADRRQRLSPGLGGDRLERVIVQAHDLPAAERLVAQVGGRVGRRLAGRAVVAEVPRRRVERLQDDVAIRSVTPDRPIRSTLDRTSAAVGAAWVTANLGFDGTGVGVAIIDSGITAAHDDIGSNQVVHFVDFVGPGPERRDRYGHGTHVAGIIAGSGHDSGGARRGIAPGAHLVVLKTLDDRGEGYISDAIAAMDYAIEQRAAYNIRVINLSVAAGVYESYKTDPLTLAAERAVEAGIVVVTAAGNQGRGAKGQPQYGGITSPGNAPWVLTVGAADHRGTIDRTDDTVASFSSLGPSSIDGVVKPDLVAPGVGIESLADGGSTLFTNRPQARIWGSVPTATEPYLRLSGTSMAAPVVTGTVALMLEANPSLKPEAVKAILQASAEPKAGYGTLAQGAGFLNARAAVELAQTFAEGPAGAERLEQLVQAFSGRQSIGIAGVSE